MANVLWAKGGAIDDLMRRLTVGADPLIDRELVVWDCVGSAAHARMLASIGLLTPEELTPLLNELAAIHARGAAGHVDIPVELEDVHTFIEGRLVEVCGDAGLKIHAGRSRNDQVLVTTRLYLRSVLVGWLGELVDFVALCGDRFDELGDVPLPGYTHMQPAMPSSVGMWLHASIEHGAALVREGLMLLDLINVNPLGASAGFGSNLPLDRDMTTQLLGFDRVQRSPIDCNNSRGRFEHRVLAFGADIAGLFEKIACDMVLYTTREYGFFTLPHELTTGSSIMPQKRNADLAELLRARGAKVRGAANELMLVTAKLTSSYNRDFQYTKEPLVRGSREVQAMFKMASLLIGRFGVDRARVGAAMYPDLYSTYEANALARSGVPYRTAYQTVAAKALAPGYDGAAFLSEFAAIAAQTARDVVAARAEVATFRQAVEAAAERFEVIGRTIFSAAPAAQS